MRRMVGEVLPGGHGDFAVLSGGRWRVGAQNLDANEILGRKIGPAAQTALQANEDRARVFRLLRGDRGDAGGEMLWRTSVTSDLTILAILFGGLTVLGFMSVLKLAKLRVAWTDSVRAMCQIKAYYVKACGDPDLGRAFRWAADTIPPANKKWTVAFVMAVTLILLTSGAACAALILCGLAASGNCGWSRVRRSVWWCWPASWPCGSLCVVISDRTGHRILMPHTVRNRASPMRDTTRTRSSSILPLCRPWSGQRQAAWHAWPPRRCGCAGGSRVHFSGGSLPGLLCPGLVGEPLRSTVTWPAWHVFWVDERCVPLTDPLSNYRRLRERLDRVAIPAEQVHCADTARDPETAAAPISRTWHARSIPHPVSGRVST